MLSTPLAATSRSSSTRLSHKRRVPRVGVSKSGNTPRFFPDARFGTDRGPTVHAVRASDALFLCHELCAGNHLIALAGNRRAEVKMVPNFGGESVVCASADKR
jgi:hypothetical protein